MGRGRRTLGRRCVRVAASSLATVIAVALTAAPAIAVKRPDLVVASAKLTSKRHVFLGDDNAPVEFKAKTKNIGKRRADRTRTRLLFARKPTNQFGKNGPAVGVPRLSPGESDTAGKSSVGAASLLRLGSYYVVVCADDGNTVVERDEDNNCLYTGQQFDVIADTWRGNVSGHHPLSFGGNVTERWSAPDELRFTFDHGAGGVYTYLPHGDLEYKVTGKTEQPGITCTYSGKGSYDVAGRGRLDVDYRHETYTGLGSGGASYTYRQVCATPSGTITNPYQSPQNAWWVTCSPPAKCPKSTHAFGTGPVLDDTNKDTGNPYDPLYWDWTLTGQG